MEPVQGEGGVHPLDVGFMAAARALCDAHDALLLFDEVQTGIGRCGAWLAFHRLGVEPDAVTLAKGLGSGLPIGALVARAVEDGFAPGDHATTFGGSPPIAAAALAVLDAIAQEGLVENAEQVGRHLAGRLRALPGVADVRGLGLLLAVELRDGEAGAVAGRLLDAGRAGQRRDRRRRCACARPCASPRPTWTAPSRRSRPCSERAPPQRGWLAAVPGDEPNAAPR